MKYLSYIDSYEYENKRYFSAAEFNGLFCESLDDGKIEYLGSFPREELFGRLTHKNVVGIDEMLYFFPFSGKGITSFDIKKKKFSFWNLGIENQTFTVVNAFKYQFDILIIPAQIKTDIYVFNTITQELKNIPCFDNAKIGQKDDFFVDFFGSTMHKDNLYIANRNTNHIYEVELENYNVKKYQIENVSKIRSISFCDEELWATDIENLVAYNIDLKHSCAERVLFEESNLKEEILSRIVVWNGKKVALPGLGNVIYEYDVSKNIFICMDIQISGEWLGDVLGYCVNNEEIVFYVQNAPGFSSTMRDGYVRISKDGKVDRIFVLYQELEKLMEYLRLKNVFPQDGIFYENTNDSLGKFIEFIKYEK